MLGRSRRRRYDADAFRRVETMPRVLWHDRKHPGAEFVGLQSLFRHQVQSRRAVDDLNDLVAVRMALPGGIAGKLGAIDVAVAVGRQRYKRSGRLSLRLRRFGPATRHHPHLSQTLFEIKNIGHSSSSVPLSFDLPSTAQPL